jgi:hypothetical protein
MNQNNSFWHSSSSLPWPGNSICHTDTHDNVQRHWHDDPIIFATDHNRVLPSGFGVCPPVVRLLFLSLALSVDKYRQPAKQARPTDKQYIKDRRQTSSIMKAYQATRWTPYYFFNIIGHHLLFKIKNDKFPVRPTPEIEIKFLFKNNWSRAWDYWRDLSDTLRCVPGCNE